MRRVLISAASSAVIAAGPFIADYVWPTAPPFLVIALYPGLYYAGFFFDLGGCRVFDQSGDLQTSFTVAMIAFSFAWWLAICYGTQLISVKLERRSAG
jgi:hypothetical protein